MKTEMTYSEFVYELLSAGFITDEQSDAINKYLLIRKEGLLPIEKIGLPVKKQMIKDTITGYFGVTWEEIISTKRDRRLVTPRHLYFYSCATMLNESLKKIGNELGRDHTSVIHARDKISKFISINDSETLTVLSRIKTKMNKLILSI